MKKRILALLLIVIMVVSVLPTSVFAAENGTPEFTNVNMTLNGVLNVNFKVEANGADMSQYSVRVTVGSDEKYQDIQSYTRDGKLYVYTAMLVAHRMGEALTAQLMKGDAVVEEKIFTVATYVADVKTQYPGDAEMHKMLDAMVNYGTYAAYYAKPTGTAPSVSAVENVTKDDVSRYQFDLIQTPTGSVNPVVSLYLAKACDLRIKFDAAAFAGHKLLINGEQVVLEDLDGTLMYTIPELIPQNWDKEYNIKVLNASNATVFEVEYSVLSYVYNQLRKTTEARKGLNSLLKAMYLYYGAVEEYIGKNGLHDSVVTPNSDRYLTKNGVENRYIFMFDNTNANVKQAVDFMNDQFNAVLGYKLSYPGTTDPVNWDESKRYIVVGNRTMFTNAGLTMPEDDLGKTGYYIVSKGNSIFIMADEDADEAQAYQLAALKFLNVVLGYEMYSADCVTYGVDGKNVTLPDMQIVEKPDIDYRSRGDYKSVGTGTYGMGYTNNSIFMSVNGNVYHTALDLLDPNSYYGNHKNWFFLESQNAGWWDQIVGNQRYDHYQLCYSEILKSEEALDIMYTNLKNVVLDNPTLDNVSLGVADNNYICDCSGCQADGVGNYIRVANLMAQRMVDDPDITRDVKLIAFAYRQYKTAPTSGVVTHRNVGVMVAPIEAAYNTPISGQAEFANNIRAWSELTDHLYLWFYQTNFDNFLYPMDSWKTMQDNIKFAREVGADFIFYQGQGKNDVVSHFSMLKNYLESHWLRNADADYDTLVNNFFTNYYGPAAAPMKQYYDALLAHMGTMGSDGTYKEVINTGAFWPKAKLEEFLGYIADAYAAVAADGSANAEVYNRRIRLESLFPRYAILENNGTTMYYSAAATIAAECTSMGLTYFNEQYEFTDTNLPHYEWWTNHTCGSWENVVADRYLKSGATDESGAVYFKSCGGTYLGSKCEAIGTETFVHGDPLAHEHSYTFVAGTEADAGYDVGTCGCGETVKVKTDYTASAPTDIIYGTSSTLTMPEGFTGTVNGGKFGSTLTFTDTTFDTTAIQAASHGLWTVEVNFTSEYGATHIAKVPVLLITKVLSTKADFETFATEASVAWTGGTVMYGYYILGADIDCSGTTVSAADAWNNGQFYGTLDGRGHKIQNLTATAYKTGIFGRLHGTVKDIHFTNVTMSANSALFGKITDGSTFTNVTIDVTSWATPTDNTYTGVLGLSQNQNLTLNNLVINVAEGVTVPQLIGRAFAGATGNVTVNLEVGAKIINYYSTANSGGTGVTTLPSDSIITVNQKIAETVDREVIIEGNVMTNSGLTDGAATVIFGSTTYTGTVEGGTLTITDLTATATGKQTDDVVIKQGDNTYTYTNVWHVTRVIDNVTELTAFATEAMKYNTDNTTMSGYYILGSDIDCGGASVATGNGAWNSGGFMGTLDGRGHKIKNLLVNNQGGIFGRMGWGSTVKNIHFENTAFAANSALFGKVTYKAIFTDVTVDVASWVSVSGNMTYAGILGVSSNSGNAFTNFVINVADDVSVSCLLGREFTNATGDITVNLGDGSAIVNYYTTDSGGANCVTTLPSDTIITVNQEEVYTPIEETVTDMMVIEGVAEVDLKHECFVDYDICEVSINGVSAEFQAADGILAVDLTALNADTMGKYTAVVTTSKGDVLTFTEVWYVTKVIDNVAELKALSAACKAANTTGYYILGGNIDCSGEANMAAGNPGWEANGFSGTFDGRGYTISNIKMTYDTATGGYGGLFGNLDGCVIRNVVFNKVNYASVNVALLGRHTYKTKGPDNVKLENLTINISAWAATGEAGVLVSRSSRNTLHNNITINVADGVTVHNLLGQGFSSAYGSGITVNLGTGSGVTALYWTGTDVSTAVTSASWITVKQIDAQAAAITVSGAPVAIVTKARRNIFANLKK